MNVKRMVTALLSAMLLLGLTPLQATAAGGKATVIDITDIGSMEAYADEEWEFDGDKTFIIKSDVIITGYSRYGLKGDCLVFIIQDNHTVIWEASYGGYSDSEEYVFVEVRGEGTFSVVDGGNIALKGGGVTLRTGSGIALTMSGWSTIIADGWSSVDMREYACVAVEAAGSV